MTIQNAEDRILSKADIFRVQDLERELVNLPEWGGSVYVRAMTGRERDHLENIVSQSSSIENVRARVAQMCCVNGEGKQIFEVTDIKRLGEKSAAPLHKIFEVARRLSKISPRDVEKMTENLPEGQSGDSYSD